MDGRIKELLKENNRPNMVLLAEGYHKLSEAQEKIREGVRDLSRARILIDEGLLVMLNQKRNGD